MPVGHSSQKQQHERKEARLLRRKKELHDDGRKRQEMYLEGFKGHEERCPSTTEADGKPREYLKAGSSGSDLHLRRPHWEAAAGIKCERERGGGSLVDKGVCGNNNKYMDIRSI